MKRYIISLLLLLAAGFFTSCEEEQLHIDEAIFGLGGAEDSQTELDQWLYKNFVEEYNITVKYKWSTYETSTTAQLVPIRHELVQPLMEAIRTVWFDPYEKTAGAAFIKRLTPKYIVLVGSPQYEEDGTIKLGQAEGGNKITLFDCNSFSLEDGDWLRRLLQTIEHEFAHILHQTISYDKAFKSVSAGTYNPTGWYNLSNEEALQVGFLSNYSMSGVDEDFVEIISLVMVNGNDWLEEQYAALEAVVNADPEPGETTQEMKDRIAASAEAAAALDRLRQKVQYVSKYMLDVWNIQFFDTPGQKGLVGEVQEAIDKVLIHD